MRIENAPHPSKRGEKKFRADLNGHKFAANFIGLEAKAKTSGDAGALTLSLRRADLEKGLLRACGSRLSGSRQSELNQAVVGVNP